MLGCQSRTKTLAYRSPILLPHQLQYFLSKFHFMSMVRGPTHTAMLQPCGALLPTSPPQSLRLPVAHLQELAGIYDPQMLAPHTRQHFHPSQLLLAHLCPPQSDLLSEVLLGDISILDKRGHYYRGATGQRQVSLWSFWLLPESGKELWYPCNGLHFAPKHDLRACVRGDGKSCGCCYFFRGAYSAGRPAAHALTQRRDKPGTRWSCTWGMDTNR